MQFLLVAKFLSGFCVLVSTLHSGGRGGLEASWWTGENKSCLQNKSSRFWQKCWRWRLQSFIPKTTSWGLLLCCLSACSVTLAKIFIFFLGSGPYVYVQRASDLRSLLNGWRVPELRQCIHSMRPCQLVPSFRKH